MISGKNRKLINNLLKRISYLENKINLLCHNDLMDNEEGDSLIDKIYQLIRKTTLN